MVKEVLHGVPLGLFNTSNWNYYKRECSDTILFFLADGEGNKAFNGLEIDITYNFFFFYIFTHFIAGNRKKCTIRI